MGERDARAKREAKAVVAAPTSKEAAATGAVVSTAPGEEEDKPGPALPWDEKKAAARWYLRTRHPLTQKRREVIMVGKGADFGDGVCLSSGPGSDAYWLKLAPDALEGVPDLAEWLQFFEQRRTSKASVVEVLKRQNGEGPPASQGIVCML